MIKIVFLVFTIISLPLHSQKTILSNATSGVFSLVEGSSFFNEFHFDGNGKVSIDAMKPQYPFFRIKDTIVIYPNKGVLTFLLKKDSLIGLSNWVEKQKWYRVSKHKVNSVDERTNKVDKSLMLLHMYYETTKNRTLTDFFENKQVSKKLHTLCKKGLGKACLDMIQIRMYQTVAFFPSEEKEYTVDKKIRNYSYKAAELGEQEAYKLFADYLLFIYKKEEAIYYYQKAAEAGSITAVLKLMELENK